MEDKLRKLLQEAIPDIDFAASDTLVDDGILDSITIAEIIGELSVEFDVQIPFEAIAPENFNSIHATARLVERLREA